MSASYIIRLDDACETMNHHNWKYLEEILDSLNIKPIVAVVPQNVDKTLKCNDVDPLFWNKVLSWQKKNWTIGLHGYKHDMHKTNAKQILPIYKRSEFSGLSFSEQSIKLKKGYKILKDKGIHPKVWVAPAHCFDRVTLKALEAETPIRVVSDGIAFSQYYEFNFYWIPQQLWHLNFKKKGLWTVCLHPNSMSDKDLSQLKKELIRYRDKIISVDELKLEKRKKSLRDFMFSKFFWYRHKIFTFINQIKS